MILPFRRRETGTKFVHPVQPAPRTAVLAPGFQGSRLVRVFASGWTADAARFAPSSIAGPLEELRKVAELGFELRHSVVVLTSNDDATLSDEDREFLWSAFGVPVFEQQLGPDNELLAAECGAHSGMHLVGDFPTLRRDKNTCACGNPAPRLPRRARINELTDLLA